MVFFKFKKKLIFYNSFSHSKYSHSHQNFVFLILHHFSLIESLLLLLLSHFSRVRLCDPIDVSPPGSPVPGILRARTLEWVAISLTLIKHIQNWAHLYSQAFSFSFSVVSSNTTILWVILSHKYKKHFQFSLGTSCVINHQSLLISLLCSLQLLLWHSVSITIRWGSTCFPLVSCSSSFTLVARINQYKCITSLSWCPFKFRINSKRLRMNYKVFHVINLPIHQLHPQLLHYPHTGTPA